ncbi:amidase [Acidisoma sp. C75]
MTDLHYLELLELTRLIHARELTAVEATRQVLARITALDGSLHAYVTVMAESALAAAAAADAEIAAGHIRGPLHGAPIAVKDLCWTKDAPTSAGTLIHKNFRAPEDATVVRRLREAGAIMLGKLAMTEGAYTDHHPSVAAPINPFGAAHWAGSSSSGSGVGTAAGLCYGALGSDTGGSIRFPSAAQGLTGIKGSWGRVSRYGIFDLSPTLDHIGPMARSAADAGAMLGAIAGADPLDPTAADLPVPDYLATARDGIRGLRIGIDRDWTTEGVDTETLAMMRTAEATLRELGATIVEVRFPETAQIVRDWFPLCAVEVAVAHQETYPDRKSDYGPSLAELIEQGHRVSGLDYQRIVLRRLDFAGRVRALFKGIDLLLLPVQSIAAPTLDFLGRFGANESVLHGMLKFTCPFDMSGHPTITLPGAFTATGMPIGFQFAAALWNEALLVRAGTAFQSVTDWHHRHPTAWA